MKRGRRSLPSQDIPTKANRVLNLVLLAFMLIILRIWHLSLIQHEERQEHALRPQRRTFIEAAKRGTIRDRFNIPLAVNRIQYNASLLYSQLREIPSIRWETDENGKRIKRYKRKEYIAKLSKLLAKHLGLDPNRVEDLIHSKGALYNQIPFTIKEDITEKEYYALHMLEKDWPGIYMQILPRRHYPQERVASDIIGYLGAINRTEYEKFLEEMNALQNYSIAMELDENLPLPEGFDSVEQMHVRLKELKAKSYTLTDRVGKTGIEARYERDLRGLSGKKSYHSNARGNLLKELPGADCPLSGKRLLLTISAELQEYAEKLLIQNEEIRETRATCVNSSQKRFIAAKKPWIKGGAIVVLEPNTGEVLALASHPRYDPNDFILRGDSETTQQKCSNIMRWLESEGHIAELWDQKRPLERELYDRNTCQIIEEKKMLSWEVYLQAILEHHNPLLSFLSSLQILQAIDLIHKKHDFLGTLSTDTQNLCLDLCHIAIDETRFTPELIQAVGNQTLAQYRDLSAAYGILQQTVYKMTKELFHDHHFSQWRLENEKSFLAQKRLEEKAEKRYAKPYIDLLDAEEQQLFKEFWTEHQWDFLKAFLIGSTDKLENHALIPYFTHFLRWHHEIAQGAHTETKWHSHYLALHTFFKSLPNAQQIPYLQTFRNYSELTRPLIGKYPSLPNYKTIQIEKNLAAAFYPRYGYGYGRSQAYRQSAPQGSIFKLVVAYEALLQRYQSFKDTIALSDLQLNPLEITDTFYTKGKESFVGYTAEGKPIPRFYKGGRIPKSLNNHLGKMGILEAIGTSSNPYFSLLAGDVLSSPNDLAKVSRLFSYGERTGIDLPGEIPGKIPTDLETNRTGLYAMAIGQHSLVVTPLQASVMLAALTNGGKVLKPQIVKSILSQSLAGEQANSSLKIPFKLSITQPIEKRIIPIPEKIHKILLEGMHRVVLHTHATSLKALSRLYRYHPEAISDYIDLKDQLLGKTSTAESIERIDLDPTNGIYMYNHVWFGGVAYQPNDQAVYLAKDSYGTPEVVVVVYLRFGGFGKEGAPIAAQLVNKWREIKNRMTTEAKKQFQNK
ncbi:MAG: penicillin-binding transpeptidase domain-containing protein [Parachlamydiaceae bacterium]